MTDENEVPEVPEDKTVAVENPNVEIMAVDIEYEKKPVKQILSEQEDIDTKVVAKEVLGWLTSNVENYVESRVKAFKLDLVLDSEESMTEVKKLQDLYRAIPDDTMDESVMDELYACRVSLDKLTTEAYNHMLEDKEGLEKLFTRLVYYYEMTGVSNGKPLIEELGGSVTILRFEYEAFSMGVKVMAVDREPSNETLEADYSLADALGDEEEVKDEQPKKSLVKEYVIEEGFTVWIEMGFRTKNRPTSLF